MEKEYQKMPSAITQTIFFKFLAEDMIEIHGHFRILMVVLDYYAYLITWASSCSSNSMLIILQKPQEYDLMW